MGDNSGTLISQSQNYNHEVDVRVFFNLAACNEGMSDMT